MRQLIFLLAIALLGLSMVVMTSQVTLAQEPEESVNEPPELSEPVETKYSTVELITKQTERGKVQEPTTVYHLERVQTATFPSVSSSKEESSAPRAMNTIVTLWAGINWYQHQQLWHVWSLARTQTNECVQAANVWVEHQYKGSSGGWQRFNDDDQELSDPPCHNDSGIAETGRGFYQPGTQHRANRLHLVRISGQEYKWPQIAPGPLTVP